MRKIDIIPHGKRPQLLGEARAYLNDSIVDARKENELTEFRADAIREVLTEYDHLLSVAKARGWTYHDILLAIKPPTKKKDQVAQPSKQGSKVADLSRHAS
jgi:hypothetical protein